MTASKRSLFILAALLAPACAGPSSIPMPAAGPEALAPEIQVKAGQAVVLEDEGDLDALEGLAEFFDLGPLIREKLWPKWPIRDLAVALSPYSERWIVANHVNPPSGLRVVDQDLLPFPVYAGALDADPPGDEIVVIRGVPTLTARIDGCGRAEWMVLLIHLWARHALDRSLPAISLEAPGDGGDQRVDESACLARALDAGDEEEAIREAAVFLKKRLSRRAGLSSERTEWEHYVETREGLIFYLELGAVILVGEEAAGGRIPCFTQGTLDYEGAAARARDRGMQMIEQARTQGFSRDWIGLCVSGMMMARLLDRLAPEWKTSFLEKDGITLEDLLSHEVRKRLGPDFY